MRYAQMRSMDISNGEGIGISLFVQGCHFHCENCFNPDTWDFNGGAEWIERTKKHFIELSDKNYIRRISILGGEPLASENVEDVLSLIEEIRISCPNKSIWLYTGYTWEELFNTSYSEDFICTTTADRDAIYRQHIIKNIDVLVDGRYIDSQRDITLKWRGSKNQRVIDVKKTLASKLSNGECCIYV